MFQEEYIEWDELTLAQRAQAETMFSATKLIGGRFDAYVYMVGKSGTVICRRAKSYQLNDGVHAAPR